MLPAIQNAKNPIAQNRVLLRRCLEAVAPMNMPSHMKAGQPMAGITCGDERMNILFTDMLHEGGELVLGEESLDLHRLFSGVASHDLVQGAAAVQRAHDVFANLLILGRYYY